MSNKINNPEYETVAIYSTKNVSWPGVGNIKKGYNIVKPHQEKQWLTKDFVRSATPEEVAQEYIR